MRLDAPIEGSYAIGHARAASTILRGGIVVVWAVVPESLTKKVGVPLTRTRVSYARSVDHV